ncbi:hypothetical protein AAFF_G00208070 [Aldrovandia affinis]|uniref:DUF4806 domain-containing protein n=1 Tax=Aldrovandia affinis TaxID=143900 RepID=A0AAD7RHB4_9TELE|nr:hypothetical protein AAFF_G00208070 [Aldrovandia affinis]
MVTIQQAEEEEQGAATQAGSTTQEGAVWSDFDEQVSGFVTTRHNPTAEAIMEVRTFLEEPLLPSITSSHSGSRHHRHSIKSRSRSRSGSRHSVRSRHDDMHDRSRDTGHGAVGYRYNRSHHSDGLRDTARSRHDDRDTARSRHDDRDTARSRHDDRDTARSRHDDRDTARSRHDDRDTARSRHDDRDTARSRHDDRDTARWVLPLPPAVFQKKILTILVDIREEVRRIARAEPASSASHVERLETVDDFQREEQRLSDSEAFNALVLQLSRVGGKDLKDCVHKVLDRLFSNALLAKFNMKGKGNKGKLALEKTRCFGAVQAAVMKFNAEATEEALRQHAGDHIKHAPARRGGGGHSNTRESPD